MSWYVNVSIRTKLWLATGTFFLSLVLVIVTAFWAQQRLSSDLDEIANRYYVASNLLLQADTKLYRAVSAERSVIFVRANTPKFDNLVNYHKQNIEDALEGFRQFQQIMDDDKTQRLMNQYDNVKQDWLNLTFQIIELRQSDEREKRREASRLSLNDASQKFAEMHDVIDQVIDHVGKESQKRVANAETNKQAASTTIIIVTIIVLVLGTLMTYASISAISNPIAELIERLKQISSGDGDLTQRLNENRQDEIGATAQAFNQFVGNQANIIHQVKGSMESFMSTMQYVQEEMRMLQGFTSTQQSESDVVSESMGQMSNAVDNVADNASKAAESTKIASELAAKGQQVVSESVATINQITHNIDNTSEVVKQLASRSESITSVTDAISEITDQTNLLALNAAIEAARAGEQGRGFAVVAEEVRNLAKKTQELTDEIRHNIEGLSKESADAVEVMAESMNNSKLLDEKASQSGQALQEITQAVSEISGMNMTVASAVEEQSVTAQGINNSISQLKNLAIESDEHAQETVTKVQSLISQAGKIQQLLNRFKVEAQ